MQVIPLACVQDFGRILNATPHRVGAVNMFALSGRHVQLHLDDPHAYRSAIEQLLQETRQLLQSTDTLDSLVALDASDLSDQEHDHHSHDMAA